MNNYPPPYHTETDENRIFAAIDAIRHATLLVPGEEGPLVSFTPFFPDRGRRRLHGHVAARNPQATRLDGTRVDAIFHGPHAYISPKLNGNEDVPTWNYVNVHVRGSAHVIGEADEKWRLMQEFVAAMEGDNTADYLAVYTSRLKPMLRAITIFAVDIESLTGRVIDAGAQRSDGRRQVLHHQQR
jgi:transcriptional regulator